MNPVPDVAGRDITQKAQEALQKLSKALLADEESFLADEESFAALIDSSGSLWRKTALTRAVQMDRPFRVQTHHGAVVGQPGDWLCKGSDGEYWPVKKEIFEAIYEQVEKAASA